MMNLLQNETLQKEVEGRIKNAELFFDQGLKVLPIAGILPDGSCSCSEGKDCKAKGKHPYLRNWQEKQLTTKESIRLFCMSNPYMNIAIHCDGLCVVDVDKKSGGIESFKKEILPLLGNIQTLVVNTPGGGFHVYFRTSEKILNSTGIIKGIDIKSKNGLVVTAGSKHVNGGIYNIGYSGTPKTDELYIADLPEKLLNFIQSKQNKKSNLNNKDIGVNNDYTIPNGERNDVLFKYACSLRRRGISIDEIRFLLKERNKNCAPPLDDEEIEKIINSIQRYSEGPENIDWKDPVLNFSVKQPLTDDIDPAILPDYSKDFIIKAAENIGLPLAALFVAIATVFSAILGSAFRVSAKLSSNYKVSLNVWGVVIAPPSSKKTSAFDILEEPIKSIENYYAEERDKVLLKIKDEQSKLKAEKKTFKNDEVKSAELEDKISNLKSQPIPNWLFMTNDNTPEALLEVFRSNYRGILLARDELRGIFDSLHKKGYENLRSILTESFNGGKSYSLTRVTRGLIQVDSMTLSILGGLQPDVMMQIFPDELRRGQGSDGLLARFQLICNYSSSQVKPPNYDVSYDLEKRDLHRLLIRAHEITKQYNQTKLPFAEELYFSDAGYEVFQKYSKHIHACITNEDITNQGWRSHIGKFERLVMVLAAQFYIIDNLRAGQKIQKEIPEKYVSSAIEVAKYMEYQLEQLYFSMGKNLAAQALVTKILNGSITDGMSLRKIYKHEWSHLKDKDAVLAAIEDISESNWVALVNESPKGGGPITTLIKLNPKLIQHLAETKQFKNGAV